MPIEADPRLRQQRHVQQALAVILMVVWCASISGCNDSEFGVRKRRPNLPPQTVLSSGPPDSTYDTDYRVHLYWSGGDADGVIDHWDFILVDHPAQSDSIRTHDPGAANRVVVTVPTVDDMGWTPTAANDTILVTRADQLHDNQPPPPGSSGSDIDQHNRELRARAFERWHTFFVRAVDNEGVPDPTPDYRSFNSRTLAPVVSLQSPVKIGLEFRAPPTAIFNWDGVDPVSESIVQSPVAARWLIVPSARDAESHYRGLPEALYAAPDNLWSAWRPWDASDGSGRSAIVRNLQPVGDPGRGFYLFAVQAMDDAGAVSPVFDWTTPGKNNATTIFVTGDVGPILNVREPFLGQFSFTGGSRPVQLDVAAGELIRWCWSADASSYGGRILAYRFAWDVVDPGDDASWDQGWSESSTCAAPRIFNSGYHTFFLETRDNAESITRAQIQLAVRQVTRTRELLLVDDSIHPLRDEDPNELREDTRWLAVVDSLRAHRDFAFDALRDIYDVRAHGRLAPPLGLLFDYKAVVWLVVASSNGSALGSVAALVDPFMEGQNSTRGFNYVNLYLDNGGKMWVCGQQPTFTLAPLVGRPAGPVVPVNITNWNLELHAEEDSVGVGSLLYRLGVEAMDQASGGFAGDPRFDRLQHGVTGLRRAQPQDFDASTFKSSRDAGHTHLVVLPTTAVEQPPAQGVVLTTSGGASHEHTLTLDRATLLALRSGDILDVPTSTAEAPAPHMHTFRLRDPLGLWGAPPALTVDISTWPSPPVTINPLGGRVNVEIFNMPSYLARQTPPLAPSPSRVRVLYECTTPTPADPGRGILYGVTADGQPAFLLAKAHDLALDFTRAYCGFEPWRLSARSHQALAEFVLLREFRTGLPDRVLEPVPAAVNRNADRRSPGPRSR